MLVECDALRRFRVDSRLVATLTALGAWASVDELAAAGHPVEAADLARLVDLGVLEAETAPTPNGGPPPEPAPYWNPFDLAVHRHGNSGGYREADVLAGGAPPPPAFKDRPEGPVTDLPAPGGLDGGLGDVLDRRRSVRAYANRPLAVKELSSLLSHSARVRGVAHDEVVGDLALRPFPAAGARSELEIYVVANDVAGLEPGAHYYDARCHQLVAVRRPDAHQEGLNRSLHGATGGALSRDPPAVLLVTAVFGRVMWKYRGIGLALIYKNVGCLTQTLYLVATALGLAPCAVGAGAESANARWLGLDPLVESQVGCFLVGPAPGSGPG